MLSLAKEPLKRLDECLWRALVGKPDYMQLHPPARLRLKVALGLPFSFSKPTCEAPIFVVGCPRSGTTVVFEIFFNSPNLLSFYQESHWVWEFLHSPAKQADYSQRLDAKDLTPLSRFFIKGCYSSAFGTRRFVDKCPTNSLRIGAIRSIFPNAKIVCVLRNAMDNISSLIDTWNHPKYFPGFDVPAPLNIEGYGCQKWVHFLEPGWQSFVSEPIEKVCAHQWLTSNEYLQEAKKSIPSEDWVEVKHENIVNSPIESVTQMFNQLGLEITPNVLDFAHSLKQHQPNTESAPEIGKWKHRNAERVSKIIPIVRPMMEKLGYDTDDYI